MPGESADPYKTPFSGISGNHSVNLTLLTAPSDTVPVAMPQVGVVV